MGLKIIYRVLWIIGLLIALNAVYTKFIWEDDLAENGSELLLQLWSLEDSVDVLYLGESSNNTMHHTDSIPLPISGFIDKGLVNQVVGDLTKGAYHAGIFHSLIQNIDPESKIRTVIVSMNMRTFDQAAIHSPIETALQKQARMFQCKPPLYNRLMLTLNGYDDATKRERDRAMWEEWTYDTLTSDEVEFPAPTIRKWCELPKFLDSNGVQNIAKRALADHYVKAYAFHIDESNPRVQDFDNIVNTCSKKKLKVVFNLMAENTEYADSLVGSNLVWLMQNNRDFLVDRYQDKAIVVDNLESVPGQYYIDKHWTTEHYYQKGREIIAQNVIEAILGKP
jgi:hypothetical protein